MIEERITTLEAECANNTAALAKMEIYMNDRFQQIDEQLAELRRSKAGIELREDIDRRYHEQQAYLKARFDHTDRQFEHVDRQFIQVDRQFEQVGKQFEQVNAQFEQIGKQFEHVDKQFDLVNLRLDEERKRHEQSDKRLDRIETEMSNLGREMRSFTRWVIGSQIGVAMAILVMATKLYFG